MSATFTSETRRSRDHTSWLINALPYLVDAELGIVRGVVEVAQPPGAPRFWHFGAEAGNVQALGGVPNFALTGGAAVDPARATAKAVGEAIERYCAALYDPAELPLCSYDDASFKCVAPSEFALYQERQYEWPGFPFAPFERDTPVRWIPANDVVSGEQRCVPACMVFVPYPYRQGGGEAPIAQSISTGLACHWGDENAMIRALCEVVERDAFTITWQARISPPQIDQSTLPDVCREVLTRFSSRVVEITLFDVRLDHLVPTVLAVWRHRSHELPAVVVAAASDPDPTEAVNAALEELAHTARYATALHRASSEPGATVHTTSQEDHLRYWCTQDHASGCDFLWQSSRRVAFTELGGLVGSSAGHTLEALGREIVSTGHRPLVVDLTSVDVRGVGLRVFRAIIPGFHPLAVGHNIRALGGRRLWEIPPRLGAGLLRGELDNPHPHPYP